MMLFLFILVLPSGGVFAVGRSGLALVTKEKRFTARAVALLPYAFGTLPAAMLFRELPTLPHSDERNMQHNKTQ